MTYTENDIASITFDTCRNIFDTFGPGLLEKTYEQILTYELRQKGLKVQTQVSLPIVYKDLTIDAAYRLDMLIEDKVIIELKAVDSILPIHKAQLLTYLKLTKKKLGLLINFNTEYMGKNFIRIVNGLED